MSETMGPDPTLALEPTRRPEDITEPIAVVPGDTEVIGPDAPESEKSNELVDELKVIYNGIRASIAEKRRERAGNRMERMEHKIALYTDLGHLALTGEMMFTETASGRPAIARTMPEMRMDKRIDRRGELRADADIEAYRMTKIFGPKDSLPGLNDRQRRIKKLAVGREKGMGRMSATEARMTATVIDAEPLKLGEKAHKRTDRAKRKARDEVVNLADQPVLSRWREFRRERAVGGIQKHHAKAEKHRGLEQEAQERLRRLRDEAEEAEAPEADPTITMPITDARVPYDYEVEGDFPDDESLWAPKITARRRAPIYAAGGRRIESSLLSIASRKPAELATEEAGEDADDLTGLSELFNDDAAEPGDTQKQDGTDSKTDSPKPERSHDASVVRSSRETKLPPVDPWEVALKYTAHVRRYKAGDDDISMSDISIIKRLERDGVSEAEARRVYQRMMDEGIVDPWYQTPEDKGKSGGHRVLLTSDEILNRLNKK